MRQRTVPPAEAQLQVTGEALEEAQYKTAQTQAAGASTRFGEWSAAQEVSISGKQEGHGKSNFAHYKPSCKRRSTWNGLVDTAAPPTVQYFGRVGSSGEFRRIHVIESHSCGANPRRVKLLSLGGSLHTEDAAASAKGHHARSSGSGKPGSLAKEPLPYNPTVYHEVCTLWHRLRDIAAYYRGLNNYLHYFGGSPKNYIIMGSKTLFKLFKAPILHRNAREHKKPAPSRGPVALNSPCTRPRAGEELDSSGMCRFRV